MLKKGGGFMAYDMYLVPGGAIGRWLQAGYAARNNEPFAHTYAGMDMKSRAARRRDSPISRCGSRTRSRDEAVKAGGLPAARTHYMTMITAKAL